MSAIASKAIETASSVAQSAYNRVDPYVPSAAKSAASYAVNTAKTTIDTTNKTVGAAVDYATSTATAAKDRAVATATGAVNYAKDTASWAVNGATTTITAYTPGPVKDLVHNAVAGAQALRQDPVGSLKPYVPAFVIHTGERTYEIVVDTTQRTKDNVNAATGFIVSKVNGTVEYITQIPQVHAVIERLTAITAPVINRIRGTKQVVPAAQAEAEVQAGIAASEE
ncbi:hypothetical protein HK405_015032 [Cladochytrium tenue]|nr:hypothetical protein HK405_015032 [Cladochytrium tenue]